MKDDKEFLVNLKQDDYRKGYLSGYKLERFVVPSGVDGLSFSSAYIEGKADKQKGNDPRIN